MNRGDTKINQLIMQINKIRILRLATIESRNHNSTRAQ